MEKKIDLIDYVFFVLELTKVNSFTTKVFLSKDLHLSSEVIPHDIYEMLEFLIKRLFDYGC